MWAFERSFPGHRILSFKRSCAELLHSADLQCWFCRLISNNFRENEVDLNRLVVISEDVSCEVEILPEATRKSIPETFCVLYIYCWIHTSDGKDPVSIVPSPKPAEHYLSLALGASTTPGK